MMLNPSKRLPAPPPLPLASRLINPEDHAWFKELLQGIVSNNFQMDWYDVVPQERLIYGDYMVPGAEPTVYEEIPDLEKLTVSVNFR